MKAYTVRCACFYRRRKKRAKQPRSQPLFVFLYRKTKSEWSAGIEVEGKVQKTQAGNFENTLWELPYVLTE